MHSPTKLMSNEITFVSCAQQIDTVPCILSSVVYVMVEEKSSASFRWILMSGFDRRPMPLILLANASDEEERELGCDMVGYVYVQKWDGRQGGCESSVGDCRLIDMQYGDEVGGEQRDGTCPGYCIPIQGDILEFL